MAQRLIPGIGWVDVPTKRGDVTPDPKNPPQLGPVQGQPLPAQVPPSLPPEQGQPLPPQPKNPPQLGPVQEQPVGAFPVGNGGQWNPKNPQRLGPVQEGTYPGNDQANLPYIARLLRALTGG